MYKCKDCLIVLFVLILSAAADATVLDQVVAVVNKEVITWSELYRTMEADASPKVKEMKQTERQRVFKESEKEFLETLINVKLQLQEARNMGIRVNDEEINETIDGIKKKYSMSDEDFRTSLKKEGYNLEEYRKRMGDQLVLSKITSHIVKNKILVSDDDIRKYAEENRDSAELAEGYRISQIFFRKPQNEEEKRLLEERVKALNDKLKAGENFGELARSYSEDPSKNAGGDLGFLRKSDLGKEFGEVVSKMKAGEVSSPFWTEKGLHIIRMDEKVDKKDPAALKEEVRKILTNKMFVDKYNQWIKSLREKAFIEIRL